MQARRLHAGLVAVLYGYGMGQRTTCCWGGSYVSPPPSPAAAHLHLSRCRPPMGAAKGAGFGASYFTCDCGIAHLLRIWFEYFGVAFARTLHHRRRAHHARNYMKALYLHHWYNRFGMCSTFAAAPSATSAMAHRRLHATVRREHPSCHPCAW